MPEISRFFGIVVAMFYEDHMMVDVTRVDVIGPHRLRLAFDDGTEGELDFEGLVPFEGVFEALRDPENFARVRVDPSLGTIVWPNGADIDPSVLHARVHGRSL